tara:strand:- start:389 stop:655 length:267 start_codon:yes stop_codon:yes gene_type:complete
MYYQTKFKIKRWIEDFDMKYDRIKVSLLSITILMTLAFLLSMLSRPDSDFDSKQMQTDIQIIEKDIQSIQESLDGIIDHLKERNNAKE